MDEHTRVQHLDPDGLVRNPAFSNVVVVSGPVKTIYIGGQNGVTGSGELVGAGDVGTQTEQIMRILETALGATGATIDNVIKWTIYLVAGQPLEPAFGAFQRAWGRRADPPLITLVKVAGLARPDCLAELEAIAVVPA